MEQDGYSSERRHFPPVREGYDRAAVDAYLSDLAREVEVLTRASGELHEHARTLGDELQALTESLRAGAAEVPGTPDALPRGEPTAVAPQGTKRAATSFERSPAIAVGQTPPSPPVAPGKEDLDGARLVALNMALEGQPRKQTDAYLAERFQLDNRAKLLDEVYAAIEG